MADELVQTALVEGVLTVTLNRPEAMNALSIPLSHELTRTWERARPDEVRAVVITGAGRGFCAGADLRQPRTGDVATEGLRSTFHPHIVGLVALEKPVVAAINGAAAGAGLSLVFGADVRIAAPTAKLVPAFASLGLVPDTGVGYLAARVMGEARALRWLTAGAPMDLAEAQRLGVIDAVAEDPLAAAQEEARRLAALPGSAYALTKRMLWAQGRAQLQANLDAEIELQRLAVADPERARARAAVVAQLGADRTKG